MYSFWFAVEEQARAISLRKSIEASEIKPTWFPTGVSKDNSKPFLNLTVALIGTTRRTDVDVLYYESNSAPVPADGTLYRVPTVISLSSLDANPLRPFSANPINQQNSRLLGFGRRNGLHKDSERAVKQAVGFVVWSEWAKSELVKKLGVPSEKVLVARTGVDLEAWDKAKADYELARSRQPGQLPELVRLLFVGDDFTALGGDVLLEIWKEYPELAQRCELNLVVSKATAAAYADFASRIPNVRFYSYERHGAEPIELYLNADVMVVPARNAVSPSAVAKALAAELPIITSRVDGLTELVKNDVNGKLVENADKHQLIEAITVLVDSFEERSRLAEGARKTAEAEFDANANNAKIITFLKNIAATTRAKPSSANLVNVPVYGRS
jgi:glycosyltransferase involved in cell wall biosynthesis